MNELRNKIDQEVWTAIARNDEIDNVAVATDRILALIAEAMLSEEAVEAGAFGWANLYRDSPTDDVEDLDGGETVGAKESLRAALQAAGITPGDAREGGEGGCSTYSP